MGCTPSIHVNQSGVVYCRNSDDSPSNQSGSTTENNPLGTQGIFRAAESADEIRSRQNSIVSCYQNGPPAYEEDIVKGSAYFQHLARDNERKEASLKFGPMCLKLPTVKVLLVFAKDDSQSDALKWAAEKLCCDCTVAYTPEEAAEAYGSKHHHLVFIDSRHSKAFDPIAVCRSFHGIQGSQYSCLVAVVKKNMADKEDTSIVNFLKSGFTRWFVENYNHGICLNEMIQIHHNDISTLIKLQASQALFTALDNCRDGVIVTSADHDIQYANKASENLLGYSAQDMTGKNAQDLCRAESVKADIVESINMQVKKGKEWEGTLFHKRKSGESVPLWSRILPIETYCGVAEHLVHVNECPFNGEKPYAADTSEVLPYSCNNVKPARKNSCDVRSLCSETGLNRRQSFAKFHAMTLEPPITKVINMILATQEHSPLFVVQALDRVLDILRSTELYSPQFTGLHHNRADDQVASDLFSGLISNSKQVLRRFSHEAFKGYGPPPPTPSSLPTLATAPSKLKLLLDHVSEWDFDIIQLERITEKRPLIWVGMAMFAKFNACNVLNCDESILRNWLSLMEANYHQNPYHNSTHAADVLQSTAYFLQNPRLKAILDPVDEIISLVAAIIHDVDHPGKNSAFLCNTGNELAILYNDLSVLESHHSALAFKLTTASDKVNIFQHLSKDTYKDVRQSVIDMVLATEMTKHFEHLSKFVNVFTKSVEAEEDEMESELGPTSPDLAGMATPENVVLVKRMLIKCADVSNPARPLQLCKEWAYRIAEEYIAQTDEEKSKGLPIVMPAFDRAKCSIPKSQIGFIEYFVNDMFDAWDAFGEFPELMEHIKENYDYWKEQQQLRDQKQHKADSEDTGAS